MDNLVNVLMTKIDLIERNLDVLNCRIDAIVDDITAQYIQLDKLKEMIERQNIDELKLNEINLDLNEMDQGEIDDGSQN